MKVVRYDMCKYVQTYDRDFILVESLRMIGFLNSVQCWNFRTIYGSQKPIRNRVVVPARRQPMQPGGPLRQPYSYSPPQTVLKFQHRTLFRKPVISFIRWSYVFTHVVPVKPSQLWPPVHMLQPSTWPNQILKKLHIISMHYCSPIPCHATPA